MATEQPITLSNQEFIAWLETQPANERYDYVANCYCPIAMFLKSKGYPNVVVTPQKYTLSPLGREYSLPPLWNVVSFGRNEEERPTTWTFGMALQRAKELLS